MKRRFEEDAPSYEARRSSQRQPTDQGFSPLQQETSTKRYCKSQTEVVSSPWPATSTVREFRFPVAVTQPPRTRTATAPTFTTQHSDLLVRRGSTNTDSENLDVNSMQPNTPARCAKNFINHWGSGIHNHSKQPSRREQHARRPSNNGTFPVAVHQRQDTNRRPKRILAYVDSPCMPQRVQPTHPPKRVKNQGGILSKERLASNRIAHEEGIVVYGISEHGTRVTEDDGVPSTTCPATTHVDFFL